MSFPIPILRDGTEERKEGKKVQGVRREEGMDNEKESRERKHKREREGGRE